MPEMKCNVCKKKIEVSNGYVRISDGIACQQCWEKAGLGFFAQFGATNYTVSSVKQLIQKKAKASDKASLGKNVDTKTIKNAVKKNETKNGTNTSKKIEAKGNPSTNKSIAKTVSKQKTTMMEQIDAMEGIAFENYMKKLLEHMGYSSVQTTATTGDQGVDLLARKGMSKYAIQCKRYKNSVGNKAVQEVFSGAFFYKCDKCIVVTNSHFTASAKELAKANKVELWDRDKLKELVEKYGKHIK